MKKVYMIWNYRTDKPETVNLTPYSLHRDPITWWDDKEKAYGHMQFLCNNNPHIRDEDLLLIPVGVPDYAQEED